jgi:hypothetical protein
MDKKGIVVKEKTLVDILKEENATVHGVVVNSTTSAVLAAVVSVPDHIQNFPLAFGVAYLANAVVGPAIWYGGKKAYSALQAYRKKE